MRDSGVQLAVLDQTKAIYTHGTYVDSADIAILLHLDDCIRLQAKTEAELVRIGRAIIASVNTNGFIILNANEQIARIIAARNDMLDNKIIVWISQEKPVSIDKRENDLLFTNESFGLSENASIETLATHCAMKLYDTQ